MEQKFIDAYLRSLRTIEEFKKDLVIKVNELDELHIQPIRVQKIIMATQYQHACYEYGINSPEAEEFSQTLDEHHRTLVQTEKEHIDAAHDRVDYSYAVQKEYRNTLRSCMGDLMYMSKFGSEHEKDVYFLENNILRSQYMNFNLSTVTDSYRIEKNIDDLTALSIFMNNVVLYFKPNSPTVPEVFDFYVSHSTSLLVKYSNSLWELYNDDKLLMSNTDSLEVLQYLNIVR